MKRAKPKKSDAQLEKEQTDKESAKTAEWQRRCAKLGIAVRFSFLREIKAATGCEDAEARAIFQAAFSAGDVQLVGFNKAGDVGFYKMKKNRNQ